MEVRDALASGDPAGFRSRLPVQMDGSCNGLQHYAALSRDEAGGRSVNLLPCDRPQARRPRPARSAPLGGGARRRRKDGPLCACARRAPGAWAAAGRRARALRPASAAPPAARVRTARRARARAAWGRARPRRARRGAAARRARHPMDACARPQDVYSGIAALVAEHVGREAAAGRAEAALLAGAIDRKLVKQTVMTSVYGVTFIGARHQIAARLKERGWQTDESATFKASTYGAKARARAPRRAAARPAPAASLAGRARAHGPSTHRLVQRPAGARARASLLRHSQPFIGLAEKLRATSTA